jgi:hypothetical protein
MVLTEPFSSITLIFFKLGFHVLFARLETLLLVMLILWPVITPLPEISHLAAILTPPCTSDKNIHKGHYNKLSGKKQAKFCCNHKKICKKSDGMTPKIAVDKLH